MSAPGWAIVTGASSGIGKALAFEFAKGGFHVFLTGRNEAALADVAAECSK
jgi:17beta-estradiol 17-dehydrogenase / very-long-chain 3-oxoacyl-CoA reductase